MNNKSIFLVWGTPDKGPRSRAFAKKLGIEIHFVQTGLPRGRWYALIKYPLQAIKTMFYLLKERPRVIFIQNPPLLAVLCVYIYCVLGKSKYIIDGHSGAFFDNNLTTPGWLKQFLARRAIVTIVTNEYLENIVNRWGGQAMIIRDIPATFPIGKKFDISNQFNIALINTFSIDEPLDQVLEAASALPDVKFYVTGRVKKKNSDIISMAPTNVSFTGFLTDENYYSLLNSVEAVMCLTTRDHTMQRGACEALSLSKPIITSNWDVLNRYFRKGTVHVDNTVEGIRQGVLVMKHDYCNYSIGIKELHRDQQIEWEQKATHLLSLIQEQFNSKDNHRGIKEEQTL